MFTSFDKALAAFLGAGLSMLALWGLPVPAFLQDPATQGALVALISGVLAYVVPNKAKPAA
jgi:hypothetical protein